MFAIRNKSFLSVDFETILVLRCGLEESVFDRGGGDPAQAQGRGK